MVGLVLINGHGDIEDVPSSFLSTITTEFEGMDNIDNPKVFSQMKSQLSELGVSKSEQANIIKNNLKPDLFETFGTDGAAQYMANQINIALNK